MKKLAIIIAITIYLLFIIIGLVGVFGHFSLSNLYCSLMGMGIIYYVVARSNIK